VTITRVGSTKKFSEGWEKAFGGRKKGAVSKAKAPIKAKKKKSAKKKRK
jgi:hypothetical protein